MSQINEKGLTFLKKEWKAPVNLKQKVLKLHHDRMDPKQIACALNIHLITVLKYLGKHNDEYSMHPRSSND